MNYFLFLLYSLLIYIIQVISFKSLIPRHFISNNIKLERFTHKILNNNDNNNNNNIELNNIEYIIVDKKIRSLKNIFINFLSISICSLSFCSNSFASDSFPLFTEVWTLAKDNYFDNTFNNQDWNKVKSGYIKKLEQGADEREITKEIVSSLGDKYTRLLDKNTFESLWKYDAIGVGLLFQSDPSTQQQMVVAAPPISGSSAYKVDMHKGDVITSINGKSTDKMTAIQLLDMMSNDDSDTVEIEYYSPSANPASIDNNIKKVSLLRSKQKAVNPVSFFSQKLKNGKVAGYVRLGEFNSEAVPSLKQALDELKKDGVEEVLLDLRGNTGGGFQFALNVGGMFMSDKAMVTAVGKGMDRSDFKTSFPDGVVYDKPLLVYTDGLSASASEVLVAGLRDNCRAVSAGAKTFGKGKIQAVFGLADGEGLTMTVAQYVTPKGVVIQSKGIEPDIPLQSLNPYINLLIGSSITKPNLESIPFDSADQLINRCLSSNLQ